MIAVNVAFAIRCGTKIGATRQTCSAKLAAL